MITSQNIIHQKRHNADENLKNEVWASVFSPMRKRSKNKMFRPQEISVERVVAHAWAFS